MNTSQNNSFKRDGGHQKGESSAKKRYGLKFTISSATPQRQFGRYQHYSANISVVSNGTLYDKPIPYLVLKEQSDANNGYIVSKCQCCQQWNALLLLISYALDILSGLYFGPPIDNLPVLYFGPPNGQSTRSILQAIHYTLQLSSLVAAVG